jgi:hypothetical protein
MFNGELALPLESSMSSRVRGNSTKLKSVEFIGRHAASLSAAEEVEVSEEAVLAEFASGKCLNIAIVGGGWG